YLVDGKVIYTKSYANSSSINTTNADGTNKKALKSLQGQGNYAYIEARVYEPSAIYFKFSDGVGTHFYEFEDGAVKSADIKIEDYQSDFYPTYLLSPSDKKTFWYEPRDGKNTIFVGDDEAKNPKTLASLSDFSTYGWYGDDYVLLSKNSSELYVASA